MTRRKKKKRNLERKNTKSRHHIIPSSRGGSSGLENIAITHYKKHEAYHNLFDNQIPEEIVYTLVNKYWKGNWDYVKDAYNRYNNEKI